MIEWCVTVLFCVGGRVTLVCCLSSILPRRNHTAVLWPPASENQLAYELVNDGSTCFVDVKIWFGAYKSTYTLAKWKSEVTAMFVSVPCRS